MTDRIKEIENLLPDRLKNSLFSGMFGFRVTYDGLEEIRLRCDSRQKSGLRERITGQTK